MAKTTENFRSNTVVNPSASMNRARGRPNSWEVKTCKYCKKASILLKQKGYCKYCYKKEDGTMTKWSERVSDSRTYASQVESNPIISDNTVKIEKEDLRKLSEELGL